MFLKLFLTKEDTSAINPLKACLYRIFGARFIPLSSYRVINGRVFLTGILSKDDWSTSMEIQIEEYMPNSNVCNNVIMHIPITYEDIALNKIDKLVTSTNKCVQPSNYPLPGYIDYPCTYSLEVPADKGYCYAVPRNLHNVQLLMENVDCSYVKSHDEDFVYVDYLPKNIVYLIKWS